jgi:outer membrane protein assembly factor BamE (lipoprotein component of BamABCDE complex)
MGISKKAIAAAIFVGVALLAGCASGGITREGDARFANVQRGMTEDEVQQLLGAPDETMPFPLSQTVSWDYRYTDTWGYMADYSVTFGADGRVESTFSRRLNDGGDHGGR